MEAEHENAIAAAAGHFTQAQRVATLSLGEYESHVNRFPFEQGLFAPHIMIVSAYRSMAQAGMLRIVARQNLASADTDDARDAAKMTLRRALSLLDDANHAIRYYVSRTYRVDAFVHRRGDPYEQDRAPYEQLLRHIDAASDGIEALLD
jgi:hypothetical protein